MFSSCEIVMTDHWLLINSQFKKGNIANAYAAFQKALRYLDMHPQMPEETPEEAIKSYEAL